MKRVALRLVPRLKLPDGVPAELGPFVEALAELLAEDYLRRQQEARQPMRRVRLLPVAERGR